MWPFKKKKIYKVEYKDRWNDYGCSVVKATDKAEAWNITRKQHGSYSNYRATVCVSITELKDA